MPRTSSIPRMRRPFSCSPTACLPRAISSTDASTYVSWVITRSPSNGCGRRAAQPIELARIAPYPSVQMTAAASGNQAQFAPRLNAVVQLGEYVLGQPLWPLRIADAYRANGPKGAATVYVIHAQLSQDPTVR